MDRITLRLPPSLGRALQARAERDHAPAAQIAREALTFHLDRLSIADIFGDRVASVCDRELQRSRTSTHALAEETTRLQQMVRDLLTHIEGADGAPPSEQPTYDARTERLLENLISTRSKEAPPK